MKLTKRGHAAHRAWSIIRGIALILSLLICIGGAAMWMRSYRVFDGWRWEKYRFVDENTDLLCTVKIASTFGGVEMVVERGQISKDHSKPVAITHYSDKARPLIFASMHQSLVERLGFRVAHDTRATFVGGYLATEGSRTIINIPYWFPTALGTLFPTWLAVRLLLSRRIKAGCCQQCGYDLRASTERCPECGTKISGLASLHG